VWADIGGFDESFRTAGDYDFFFRVTARHDIVYIDIPLEVIVWHDANISSVNLVRVFVPSHYTNHIRVLERQLSCSDNPCITERLRRHLQRDYFGLAYHYRNAGQYRLAISACRQSRTYGGSIRCYWESLAKLAVHRCLACLRLV
jgi:hypothetical protein